MHAYIYLRITHRKGPNEEQERRFACIFLQRKIKECSHGKVIHGMGRSETGTQRPVSYEYPDGINKGGIIAGPEPENIWFDDAAADKIR